MQVTNNFENTDRKLELSKSPTAGKSRLLLWIIIRIICYDLILDSGIGFFFIIKLGWTLTFSHSLKF
jgi:hypothetical protein